MYIHKYRVKLLFLIGTCIICACLYYAAPITAFIERLTLNYLLGDVPAPPNYAIKYTGYNSGWALSYDTNLSFEAVKNFYIAELPEQNWAIEYYSETAHECIFATRNGVVRIIEVRIAPQYTSRVEVRFDELSCHFEPPP